VIQFKYKIVTVLLLNRTEQNCFTEKFGDKFGKNAGKKFISKFTENDGVNDGENSRTVTG